LESDILTGVMDFYPHISMDLTLLARLATFARLPSGCGPGEAKLNELGIGPLHNFLKKELR
jgi:hypothetical protein